MSRLTRKGIVKAIKAEFGVDVEMWTGEGYFYFSGDCVELANQTGVYVYRLNDVSITKWMESFKVVLDSHDESKKAIESYSTLKVVG